METLQCLVIKPQMTACGPGETGRDKDCALKPVVKTWPQLLQDESSLPWLAPWVYGAWLQHIQEKGMCAPRASGSQNIPRSPEEVMFL